MKRIFFLLLISCFLFQCKKQTTEKSKNDWTSISNRVAFKATENFLEIKSGKFNYKIDEKELPFKKAIFLNASLIGFATELSLQDQIIGVSSPEYIYSEKILQKIQSGKISDVGNEQKYNVEKIIALQPDVIFTNYIAGFENTYNLLKENGIKIIFLDEYLEQDPLEKSAYVLLFGKLFNKEKDAENLLKNITKHYTKLKELAGTASAKPVVLANEMYGNQWFLPGGKSQLAKYLRSANSIYINADNDSESAQPLSFEEVFVKAENADIWVNVGNHHTKKELLMINPNYAKMNIFKKGKIYSITGKERKKSNDFFESGVVRADLVLQDYVKIMHPELLPKENLIYLKELE